MTKVSTLNYLMDTLKILGENEYSLLWDICDDLEYNGHIINIKDSTQFKHVIIDNRYVRIGGRCTIIAGDKTYEEPLDYVRDLLERGKEWS